MPHPHPQPQPTADPPHPADPALTPHHLAQFTAMLCEQQRFRRGQIATAPTIDTAAERHDRTSVQAEIDAVILRGAIAALAEIDAALDRMRQGSYGLCTACGGAISVERLEILPQTARCISCERRA